MTYRTLFLILGLALTGLSTACDNACSETRASAQDHWRAYKSLLTDASTDANNAMSEHSSRSAQLANEGSGQAMVLEAQAASSAAAAERGRLDARIHEVELIVEHLAAGRVEEAGPPSRYSGRTTIRAIRRGVGPLPSSHGTTHQLTTDSLPMSLTTAFVAIYFAYAGWNAVAYVGGEVTDPHRNIPLSLLSRTLATTVLYVLLCAAFLSILGIVTERREANLKYRFLSSSKPWWLS
jgi:hypothetical protein